MRQFWWGLLVLLVVQGGCEARPVPTSPAERILIGLIVRAPKTDVNVGESIDLQAVSLYSDGSEAIAPAEWSAVPNAVAIVTATGRLTGLKLGTVAVTARSGERSGVAVFRIMRENGQPARIDLSGMWRGQARISECERIAGPGPNPCATGVVLDVSLLIQQANYLMAAETSIGVRDYVYAGTVTGWRDYIGNMFMTGTLSNRSVGSTVEITGWETRVSPPWSTMTGYFEAVENVGNDFGAQVMRLRYELIEVAR